MSTPLRLPLDSHHGFAEHSLTLTLCLCGMGPTYLESLPSHLLLEILSRVRDAGDLASCRLASRTLHALSTHVSSLALSLSPNPSPVPFKSRVLRLVSLLAPSLRSLSLSTSRAGEDEEDEGEGFDEADDLLLTSVDFISTWLDLVCERLVELCIADCWSQSCFRRSDALALVSELCNKLIKLEVRNAWLSVYGLKPMPRLTSLTLEFIRLDDENLDKVNECFPNLQFLSLIDVGGLKRPRMHLSHLKTLFWKVSNTPLSLSVHAPHLTELHLSCIEPKFLSLDTPRLSLLDLTITTPSGDINMGDFQNSISVRFITWDCSKLFSLLNGVHTVKTLELGVPDVEFTELESSAIMNQKQLMMSEIVDLFSGLEELKLVGAAKRWICDANGDVKVCLKRVIMEVEESDLYDFGAISKVLKMFTPCEVALLFPAGMEISATVKNDVIDKYARNFPEFRWR